MDKEKYNKLKKGEQNNKYENSFFLEKQFFFIYQKMIIFKNKKKIK